MSWLLPAPKATACGSRARSGAAIEDDHESPVFWTPVSETAWLDGGRGAYPHLALDRAKPGLIAVNAAGRRFVDEAVSYHDFVLGMHRSHETVPTIPAWLVCDRAFIHKYGLGRIPPGPAALGLGGEERLSRRGATRSMRWRKESASMPRGCATSVDATTASPKPATTSVRQGLDRVRPQQRRSAARPNPASDRSARRPTTPWRSIRARSAPASG